MAGPVSGGDFLEELARRRLCGGRSRARFHPPADSPGCVPRAHVLAAFRRQLAGAEDTSEGGSGSSFCVIAEIKRSSPSRGVLNADLRPAEVARAYVQAGASAISVLTEPHYFGGSVGDLAAVRAVADIPVLRKDFITTPSQIEESAAWGADLILLMVSLLGLRTEEYVRRAREVGLEPLVEIHDEEELDVALSSGADLIGVNNRNLRTLVTDREVSRRLLPRIPTDRLAVCESGLSTRGHLQQMAELGARAFLVGEALVSGSNPGAVLAGLLGRAEKGQECVELRGSAACAGVGAP